MEKKTQQTEATSQTPQAEANAKTAKLSLFSLNKTVAGLSRVAQAQTERIDGMSKRLASQGQQITYLKDKVKKLTAQMQKPVAIEYTYDPNEAFVLPAPAKPGSIGDDLVTTKDITIPHGRSKIPVNLILNLPLHIEAKIESRSGFSLKGIFGRWLSCVPQKWLGIPFCTIEVEKEDNLDADVLTGKIDPGYHDRISIVVKNNVFPFTIPAGTHLAQITYYRTVHHRYTHVDSVEDFTLFAPNRGGGFGHTDNENENDNDNSNDNDNENLDANAPDSENAQEPQNAD